jgi:hypothetical protein
MAFSPGTVVCAVRQTSTAAFSGAVCQDGDDVVFTESVNPITNVIEYSNPSDRSLNEAVQGGEFTFDTTVLIKEIRGACGDMTVTISDLDDTHATVYETIVTDRATIPSLVVQKTQKLKISSSAAGWVDVYVVISSYTW